MPRYKHDNEEFAAAVANSRSLRGALASLGVSPAGGNYETARRRIAALKLDTSHFTGQGWRRGTN